MLSDLIAAHRVRCGKQDTIISRSTRTAKVIVGCRKIITGFYLNSPHPPAGSKHCPIDARRLFLGSRHRRITTKSLILLVGAQELEHWDPLIKSQRYAPNKAEQILPSTAQIPLNCLHLVGFRRNIFAHVRKSQIAGFCYLSTPTELVDLA